MKKSTTRALPLSMLLLALSSHAAAHTKSDIKPAFGVGSRVTQYPEVEWLQGEAVRNFDPQKTYIIEAWATWCGPCLAVIPHMNALHKKYGQRVVFIGQDIWETSREKVRDFLEKQGDKLSYRVAFGGGQDSDFSLHWMKAAGDDSIPQTFVIQNNTVIWTPRPEDLTDQALQLLIERKFDLKTYAAHAPQSTEDVIRNQVFTQKKYGEALAKIDSFTASHPGDTSLVYLKAAALKGMGQRNTEAAYLKEQHAANTDSDIQSVYYDFLKDQKQWRQLAAIAKADVSRAGSSAEFAKEARRAWYDGLVNTPDIEGAAQLLRAFAAQLNDYESLLGLALVRRGQPFEPATRSIDNAAFDIGKKCVELAPGYVLADTRFPALLEIVRIGWNTDHKEDVKKMLNTLLTKSRKEGNNVIFDRILAELSASLNRNEYPSEEKRKEWMRELNR